MIIVSQDKKMVINFENTMFIEIAENKKSIRCQFKDLNIWLGNYKTEERAKMILREIIDTYKFNICNAVGQKQAVYKMPKE